MNEIKGMLSAIFIVVFLLVIVLATIGAAAVLVPIIVFAVLIYGTYLMIMEKNRTNRKDDLF